MVHLVAIGVVVALSFQSSGSSSSQSTDRRTWSQAYDDAIRAINRKDWNAAIASLERAKATGQRPARDLPAYGDKFVTFIPDYYLGIAYLNLNRFADADAAFERTRQQNVIGPKDREWSAFQAESGRAAFEHQFLIAEERLKAGDFREALTSLDRARKRGAGAELQRADDLRGRIVQAEVAAKSPATTRANPPPIMPGGTTGFPGNLGQQGQLSTPTFPGAANPTPGPANTPAPGAKPPAGRSTTNPTASRGAGNPASTGAPSTGAPSSDPRTAGDTSPGLDPEQVGMSRFFTGDYAGAETQFRSLIQGDGNYPVARHQFFLACSLAARVLAGEADRSTLAEARQIYRSAGGQSPFRAESTYISPRVLDTLDGK